jgi:hypothetical protein
MWRMKRFMGFVFRIWGVEIGRLRDLETKGLRDIENERLGE